RLLSRMHGRHCAGWRARPTSSASTAIASRSAATAPVARSRRARRSALAAQLLIYPAVATHIGAFPSHAANAEAPFLPLTVMRWFRGQYHGSADMVLTDPLLAPILADV